MFPLHLDLGFTRIYYYEGFYFLISFVVGYLLGSKALSRELKDPRRVFNSKASTESLIFISVLAALAGAKLFHFLFWNWNLFVSDPLIVFKTMSGASITGGLFGAVLGAAIVCRIQKLDFYRIYGAVAPSILVAQAVGRIGCFLNGDAHGTLSSLPWAVRYPKFGFEVPSFTLNTVYSGIPWNWSYENKLISASDLLSAPLHPTQIYEAIFDVLLAVFLVVLYRNMKKLEVRDRVITWAHLGLYSLARALLQFIRADRSTIIFGNVGSAQIFLFVIFIAAAFGVYRAFTMKPPVLSTPAAKPSRSRRRK